MFPTFFPLFPPETGVFSWYTIRGFHSHFVPAVLRSAQPCSDNESPPETHSLSPFWLKSRKAIR